MGSSSAEIGSGGHICPWWFAFTFDNALRRMVHDPAKLLSPYVSEGMTVLDVGCGMGHFSIGMARLVGPSGKVFAVDLQERMLRVLAGRARRAGLAERISPTLSSAGDLGLEASLDFALAFWMVHEVPDPGTLFRQISALLKPRALLLYAEPSFHVKEPLFQRIAAAAAGAGLQREGEPRIRFSRSRLFRKAEALP